MIKRIRQFIWKHSLGILLLFLLSLFLIFFSNRLYKAELNNNRYFEKRIELNKLAHENKLSKLNHLINLSFVFPELTNEELLKFKDLDFSNKDKDEIEEFLYLELEKTGIEPTMNNISKLKSALDSFAPQVNIQTKIEYTSAFVFMVFSIFFGTVYIWDLFEKIVFNEYKNIKENYRIDVNNYIS